MSPNSSKYAGVYGRVSELSTVERKAYRLAVSVALGTNMDAIIVDNKATGFKCIDYLRENR